MNFSVRGISTQTAMLGLLVVQLLLPGCVNNTPKANAFEFASGDTTLTGQETVAVLSISMAGDAPDCLRDTLRTHLPNGPDLAAPELRSRIEEWLEEETAEISRARLQDVALETGSNSSALSEDITHLAIISGKSGHDEAGGSTAGADVVVFYNVGHRTDLRVDLFDLGTGEWIQNFTVNSWGKRSYGIVGIVPVYAHSDTAGSACDALDEKLAEFVAEGR
jgi:hypothetical protein